MAESGGKAFHKIDEIRAQNQRFESDGPEFMIFKEDDDDDDDDEMLMKSFSSKARHCCCIGSLSKPSRALLGPSCSSSSSSPCDWEKKIQSTAEINNKRRWWTRPLRNIRQIVAVHKLKTLIRRFRRNSGGCGGGGCGCGGGRSGGGSGKFQYDRSIYDLNFDEGPGQNSHFREEYGNFPDFSSRFAHIPHQAYNKSPLTGMGKFGISSRA